MKALFTLILALLISIVSFSQVEWVFDNPKNDESVHKLGKIKGNQYALLHGEDSYNIPLQLTVIDDAGNELFSHEADNFPVPFNSVAYFKGFIDMPDLSLVVLADVIIVDTLSGWASTLSEVFLLDEFGEITQSIMPYDQVVDFGASLPDGSLILLDTSFSFTISRRTFTGNDIWIKALPGYQFLDVAITAANEIVLATKQGLLVLDEDGNIATSYPEYLFERIKRGRQNDIVGLKNDSLFLLSSSQAVFASIGFPNYKIEDFTVQGDTIAVLTDSNYVYVYQYEDSLSLLSSFQLSNSEQFDFIAIGKERLAFAGSEQYGGTNAEKETLTIFLKEYSFEGEDYSLSNDVGVNHVEPGLGMVYYILASDIYRVHFKNVKVTVRNFGDKPVDTFYLHSKQYASYQKFTDLNLQPGEEIELIWDEIIHAYYFNPPGDNINLCIWTSHPDFRLDSDNENDTACGEFITTDNREELQQNSISIYPNPASDFLKIELYDLSTSNQDVFQIISPDGRLIKAVKASNSKTRIDVPVSDLPPGMYFLLYVEERMIRSSEKFVVSPR